MLTLTPAEIKEALAGSFFYREIPEICGVCTDSRIDCRGRMFIAIAGENFDGHNFVDKALANHAVAVCISKSKLDLADRIPVPVVAVDDTVKAYQQLARCYRCKIDGLQVAGVTGSVGKTSVKEMLKAIFSAAFGEKNVLATLGNTNNHIGVPQNLFRLQGHEKAAVIEMGTSAPGEISPLSICAMPDVAIVNSVAPCHLEKLIDLAGVAAEKGTVAAGLAADGYGILPADVPEKEILARAFGDRKILWFGTAPGCDTVVRFLGGTLDGSAFELTLPDGGSFVINWHLSGAHQALNAAAAASAAWALGISGETIAAALPDTTLPGMRMKKSIIDGITYINDAYNANPASMKATLQQLKDSGIDDRKLVLVLGGMRELGENSAASHAGVMALAEKFFPAARIVTVGREFELSPGKYHFEKSRAGILDGITELGDVVFAKGSRGTAVEKALPEAAW